MTEVKKVKIQNFIETQIPEFLNVDNPLFKEFLDQYYKSLEYQTGTYDLANNLLDYKKIENFNNETFFTSVEKNECKLQSNINEFNETIIVNHTIGFPSSYGLIKIGNEIITYKSKTANSFEGCVRGFSGIDKTSGKNYYEEFNFISTQAETHNENDVVENLNLIFFQEIFDKFRYQFIPGTENREFITEINLQTILSRAKDFYISKGTDTSYKILFKVLFGKEIEIIKPQDFMLRPSDNKYFITKNILVEKISGNLDPLTLELRKGITLHQNTTDGLSSAAIYNVEFRPTDEKFLYEISLDPETFILDFEITPKTKVTEATSLSIENSILVDSTIGFPESGELLVQKVNGISYVISYSRKTVNQFLNITYNSQNIASNNLFLEYGDNIIENNFAYVISPETNERIEFRIISVIDDIDYSDTSNLREGDVISLSSFGLELNDKVQYRNWLYNVPTTHKIKTIRDETEVVFEDSINFIKDASVELYDDYDEDNLVGFNTVTATIKDISNSNTIRVTANDNIKDKKYLKKLFTKTNISTNSKEIYTGVSNIQNTYIDREEENFYVAASGFPNYKINPNIRSTEATANIVTVDNEKTPIFNTSIALNLYTGEKVYVDSISSNSGISTGIYFVTTYGELKSSTQISLSYSDNDLFLSKYIQVSSEAKIKITKLDHFNEILRKNKVLKEQNLLKKFPLNPKKSLYEKDREISTDEVPIGLFLNGVEIYSPTTINENIYYGKLDNIQITNSGKNYDVINSPELLITDNVTTSSGIITSYGNEAKAHLNVSGSVKQIKIVNSGSGYDKDIRVSIGGGNGSGASLTANVIKSRITSGFRGDSGVNPNDNIITFTSPHNFSDGELIEYFTEDPIGITFQDSLSLVSRTIPNHSYYYAGIISPNQIKLYSSREHSSNKINEIDLGVSTSKGYHYFRTLESKNTLFEVNVENSGFGYSNKKIVIPSVENLGNNQNGINTHFDYIYAKGHNFNDKDLIVYSTTGNQISGISTTVKYFVKVLDENKFNLVYAGIGNSIRDEDFNQNRIIRLNSIGSGSHTFSYPPIEITIDASPDPTGGELILPILEPVVLGEIESVFIENYGVGYGASNIVNYHRRPLLTIRSSQSPAVLRPIVVEDKIVDVQVLFGGRGYQKDIDLIVRGNGKFAELYPILDETGKITSVNVINSGIGYDKNTTIDIQKRGSDAKFIADVYAWKINQVKKNEFIIDNSGDGLTVVSKTNPETLQYVNFYPSNDLRNQLNDNINNSEEILNGESPILGWSYDGFPIYGPYFNFEKNRRVRSSYRLNIENNPNLRPQFPEGFFIQDYTYILNLGDLDEYNGKFIVNEDFPEGTYAYFTTYTGNPTKDDLANSPQYPYIIGNYFKGTVDSINFTPELTQNSLDADLNLIRNTSPYYLNSNTSSYNIISNVDEKYKQEFIINSIEKSGIDSIELYNSGDNYKVGDILEFSNQNSAGTGIYASVFEISGKPVDSFNVGISTYYPVVLEKSGNSITAIANTYFNFTNREIVNISNISNSNFNFLSGNKQIIIENKQVGLSKTVPSLSDSIIVIYPNDVTNFEVDDFIKIDQELLQILEIYPQVSGLKVLRISNSGIHSVGTSNVELLPRKLTFFESDSSLNSRSNKVTYFDAEKVVSTGNSVIAYTTLSNEIINIPAKSIYIPNHSYETGQPLTYHCGIGGNPLQISNNFGDTPYSLQNLQTVYVVNNGKDFIGITTTAISSSVYFSSGIVGISHSFATQFSEVTAKIENYTVNIQTNENHNLTDNDIIKIDLTPSSTEIIKFRYDENIKRVTTDKITFNAGIVTTTTSEILIDDSNLNTGDKIVYYTENQPVIGGLENNQTYFIINENPGRIKLANYYSDTFSGIAITFSSVGVGTQSIAKINPQIKVLNGNIIQFDLDDSSLNEITSIRLYKDSNYVKELEQYTYINDDGSISLNLSDNVYPKEIYYKFANVEDDIEVKENNLIKIENNEINDEYKILKVSDNQFKFNLNKFYDSFKYSSTLKYSTKSRSALGPIESIKLNYSGKGYNRIPRLENILSDKGKNAVVNVKSKNIGRIDNVKRVKDGFDYPTDPTLLPLLSVPAVVQVEDISRVDYVGIITGGKNYNTAPNLKVLGNDKIVLQAKLNGTSVSQVTVLQNTNDLSTSLTVIPTENSNGYGIDNIVVNGTDITLELINSNVQLYPFISTGYGSTDIVFPFEIGDEIFIERCRIVAEEDSFGDIIDRDNFNSSDYDYRFFTVTGVSTDNYTVTYSMSGIKDNLQLGNYTVESGYGYVINKKDMAEFEMFIQNDLSYYSNETVLGFNNQGTNVFSAKVMKDGWDNEINELRLANVKGELSIGDKLKGQISLLSGTVTDVNIFNIKTNIKSKRDKLNDLGDRVGFLNDYYQRISDNNYYQKFSYAIKSELPYNEWKEPIKSLVHPSGFKEFSDLIVSSGSTVGMNTGKSFTELLINIDNTQSLYTKNNFAMVTEEDIFDDGSAERIKIELGPKLKPYILAKSNKVILLDDISSQFNGTSKLEIVENKPVTFISTDLYRVGVNTTNLKVGDMIGYSSYHNNPDGVLILSIGENFVGFSSNLPHRLYSVNGVATSITQNLDFYRRVSGDNPVGLSSFKLKNNNTPVFYREFDASNGITTSVILEDDAFNITNHNFQEGQKIIYTPTTQPYSAIALTSIGSGAILEPIFDEETYSVKSINVIQGGSGYNNPVAIAITGTETPHIVGIFTGQVQAGVITNVSIGNSGLGYYPISYPIGIATTSQVEGRKDIIVQVGGGIGSAIYENGYNVAITTTITGTASNAPGILNRSFGQFPPHIPVKSTTGIGTDAQFSVFITYNSTTGTPLSTVIILKDGGRGYSVGDNVSISGTYMGGTTPANDLSFKVSKVSSTKTGSITQTYTNVPGNTLVGFGSLATFNVNRIDGNISSVEVVNGGINYTLNDNISIAGTYIGGTTPGDNLFLSPTVLGTDKLPKTLYVNKINQNQFGVLGIATGVEPLNLNSLGVGTHSFALEEPTVNSFIAIDNIVQTPIYKTPLTLALENNVSYGDTTIYIQSGISSVTFSDYLKINDEYISVKNIGISTNSLLVERGVLGSKQSFHNKETPVNVYSGNYRIVNDVIYFSSPPFGPTGLPGLEVRSAFNGRAFSRSFDPDTPNKNIIFDDISNQFTGIAATEFILKSNNSVVSGMFTDINGVFFGASSGDINQNPFILVNNVLQTGGTDYVIDTPGQNTIRFISGVPVGGKITKIEYTQGFGYLPIVGASATVSVSAAGTISNVYLTGFGIGYKSAPLVSIISGVGTGAIITTNVSSAGSVTSLTIVNPGIGYTNNPLPEVKIDLPQNHYNIPLEYASGYSGIGTGAKASIIIGNGSSVTSLIIDEPGTAYKVGDVLVAPGIKTEPNNPNFNEFKITVTETFTDSFSGWYPGQFIQFDDISRFFNGFRRNFVPTVTINGQTEVISLIAQNPFDLSVTNNLFVFINDILQVPNEAYTFTGTRIRFTEAPKAGSKCTILFFRGSDLDVQQVDPPRTIKEGDIVQITENITYPFDRTQFERVVKDIVSADTIDTFTYNSIGISTNTIIWRPLNWSKQTKDRIMNGSLYSKSRPNLKSKVTPFAKVIKDISLTDTQIYVDSAIPLFSDLDETRSLTEDLRDVTIVDNNPVEIPTLSAEISPNGTISSINILNSGSGYKNISNPTVSFTKTPIFKKDPIYSWNSNVGMSTSLHFNSIGFGTAYIAVGNSGLYAVSYDETSWNLKNKINSSIDFNDVIGIGTNYVAVGSSGAIYRSSGISWQSIDLLQIQDGQFGGAELVWVPSSYSSTLNKIDFNQNNQILVAVGNSGGIFSSVGIGSTYFLKSRSNLGIDINSVANNGSIFVLVGNSGGIYRSTNAFSWNSRNSTTSNNLNDIIWDGNKFVVVGDFGIILTSTDGNEWNTPSSNNLTTNLKKISYFNNLYTVLDSNGYLYYSFNLTSWNYRNLSGIGTFNDIIGFISNENEERYISVGNTGFISYSTPVINRATAISTTTNGVLSKVTLVNEGFGYSSGISSTSLAIVESEPCVNEKIISIKAKGDFGIIKNVEYLGVGVDTYPRIKFTLESQNAPVLLSTMEYSPIQKGDYFTISNSNVISNKDLVGITTLSGTISTVGISKTFIDGIYRAEESQNSTSGITTVICVFNTTTNSGGGLNLTVGVNTFYGNYSYGIIYDYQNRARNSPKSFTVNKNNGLVGLSSGPIVYRTRGIV